jgi:hypothetical protein
VTAIFVALSMLMRVWLYGQFVLSEIDTLFALLNVGQLNSTTLLLVRGCVGTTWDRSCSATVKRTQVKKTESHLIDREPREPREPRETGKEKIPFVYLAYFAVL